MLKNFECTFKFLSSCSSFVATGDSTEAWWGASCTEWDVSLWYPGDGLGASARLERAPQSGTRDSRQIILCVRSVVVPQGVDYGRVYKIQGCWYQTILGGSTVAMCTHSLPKLHDVTLSRRSNPLRIVSFVQAIQKSSVICNMCVNYAPYSLPIFCKRKREFYVITTSCVLLFRRKLSHSVRKNLQWTNDMKMLHFCNQIKRQLQKISAMRRIPLTDF